MNDICKVTAFVVTSDAPHHLLVFEHPTAGLQLPAGTVEPGEDPITAAKREVWEETGLEVAHHGIVLSEEVRELGSNRATLLETITTDGDIFRRGHQVKIVGYNEARSMARIREEIFDYDTTPPTLLSYTEGEVSTTALADHIRRTFVLFVAQVPTSAPWSRRADGHDFRVQWTPLRRDVPLVDGLKDQKKWLTSNFSRLQTRVQAAHKD